MVEPLRIPCSPSRFPVPCLVLCVLLLCVLYLLLPALTHAGGHPNKPAPYFRLKSFTGKSVDTHQLRGRPAVLVVGRSRKSAPPCKVWMLKIYKQYLAPAVAAPRGKPRAPRPTIQLYQVIVLDTPWYLPRVLVRSKVKDFIPRGHLHRVLLEWKLAFARIWSIAKHDLPTVFVLDAKGIVRWRHKGKLTPRAHARFQAALARVTP